MTSGVRRPSGRGRGHTRPLSVEITWEYTGARDLLKIPPKIGGIGLEGASLWWGPVLSRGQSQVFKKVFSLLTRC